MTTTWEVGSSITWDGEYDGRAYQEKGQVASYDQPHQLSSPTTAPLMGEADEPGNYHALVYTLTLTPTDAGTHLELTQDGNDSKEQAEQFSTYRRGMLDGLETHAEG